MRIIVLNIILIFIIIFCLVFLLTLRKPDLLNEWKFEDLSKERLKDFETDHEGRIYLAFDNIIKVFSKEGEFLREIGKRGNLMTYAIENLHSYRKVGSDVEGEFISLADIEIDDSGYIYAADSLLNIIQKFKKDGKFIKKWGGYGRERGKFFEHLVGIAGTDSKENIYAYDTEKIQKFDSEGNYLSTIILERLGGALIRVAPSGLIYIFSLQEKKIYIYENEKFIESKDISEGLAEILDMEIGSDGDIYLLTKENIIKLSQSGKKKRMRIKKGMIPYLLREGKEIKEIYLISFTFTSLSWEEKTEVQIQVYKGL